MANPTVVTIAETRIPVTLGGRERVMVFNANAMVAYEQARGKFFMDTVTGLYDTIFPAGHLDPDGKPIKVRIDGTDLIRKISMEDLRALLWSTLHDYDKNDDPIWPDTIGKIGRQLTFQNMVPIFIAFLTGVSNNAPTKDELGESTAEETSAEPNAEKESAPQTTATNGGAAGIELPAGALD